VGFQPDANVVHSDLPPHDKSTAAWLL
jgi:hypothetical protein